jgi:hypothetical protein
MIGAYAVIHTHKHDEINAWLTKHPRITLHFTPTSDPPGATRKPNSDAGH